MLALGDEPLHPARVRAGDLRALEGRRDSAGAPVAADARQVVEALLLQVGDADHLPVGERKEGQVEIAARSLDREAPPLLERLVVGRREAGNVRRCLTVDLVHPALQI